MKKRIFMIFLAAVMVICSASCTRTVNLTQEDEKLLTMEPAKEAREILHFLSHIDSFSFDAFGSALKPAEEERETAYTFTSSALDMSVSLMEIYDGYSYVRKNPVYRTDEETALMNVCKHHSKGGTEYMFLLSESVPAEGISNEDYCASIVQKMTDIGLVFCERSEKTLGKYTYTYLGFASNESEMLVQSTYVDVCFRVHDDMLVYLITIYNGTNMLLEFEVE